MLASVPTFTIMSAPRLLMVEAQWHGTIDYQQGLRLQDSSWQQIHTQILDPQKPLRGSLVGLEHPAVITLGKRGSLQLDLDPLAQPTGIPVLEVDRGGQATLHSEGQLVIYPIFPLRELGWSVRGFVELLQTTTAAILLRLGIETHPAVGAGLATSMGKIAFIGLRVENGITRHGLSLNVSNDLTLFRQIRSCGVSNASLDSIASHRTPPSLEDVFHLWIQEFKTQIESLKSI